MRARFTIQKDIDRLGKKLKREHSQLLSQIDSRRGIGSDKYSFDANFVGIFKSQQTGWDKYIQEECQVIGALSGGDYQWQQVRAATCVKNLIESRLKRIRHAMRCLKKPQAPNTFPEAEPCLYQLAPLAIPLR
jgi:hypothetical protein